MLSCSPHAAQAAGYELRRVRLRHATHGHAIVTGANFANLPSRAQSGTPTLIESGFTMIGSESPSTAGARSVE
jgi:hypothetical protein